MVALVVGSGILPKTHTHTTKTEDKTKKVVSACSNNGGMNTSTRPVKWALNLNMILHACMQFFCLDGWSFGILGNLCGFRIIK